MKQSKDSEMTITRIFGAAGIALLCSTGLGCAAMTEPDVRAYLHEQNAYGEIKKGELQKAESELRLALRDTPREPTILNNMAYIEYRQGHYQKAIGLLEQARVLRSDDNDEPYIMNEARILIAHHNYRRALALLSLIKARHVWPKDYQKIMAEALLRNGRSAEALAILLTKHDLPIEKSQLSNR